MSRRRQLTPEQCAAIAVELEGVYAAEARERQREAGAATKGKAKRTLGDDPSPSVSPVKRDESSRSISRAAAAVGAGIKSTQALKAIREDAPEIFDLAKEGKVLVEAIASRMKAGLLVWADREALVAWGLIGLLAAAGCRRSHGEPAFTIHTFRRIRNAMLYGALAALRELLEEGDLS